MPITPIEFRKDKRRVARLSAILEDPIFREAVEIVIATVMPRADEHTTLERAGVQQFFGSGVTKAFLRLAVLGTSEDKESKSDEQEPFMWHMGGELLTPEQIEAKIAKQRKRNQNPDK
jgi:hypothetical protein